MRMHLFKKKIMYGISTNLIITLVDYEPIIILCSWIAHDVAFEFPY